MESFKNLYDAAVARFFRGKQVYEDEAEKEGGSLNDKGKSAEEEKDFAFNLGLKYGKEVVKILEKVFHQYFRDEKPPLEEFLGDFDWNVDLKWKGLIGDQKVVNTINDNCYNISFREASFHFKQGFYSAVEQFKKELKEEYY